VYLSISKVGADVYSNSVSVSDRTNVLLSLLKQSKIQLLIFISILLGISTAVSRYLKNKNLTSILLKGFVATSGLISIYVIQFIFYNGAWPNNTRYDFPGVLVIPLFWSVVAWIVYKILESKDCFYKSSLIYSVVGYIFLIYIICSVGGYQSHKATALGNVHNSKLFTKRIHRLKRLFLKSPEVPVIFVTSNPIDYEAIFSYQRFLQNDGVINPISVEPIYSTLEPPESLFGKLQSELLTLSKSGDDKFRPLPQSAEKCFAVIFSGQQSSLGCKIV
jgi:hypothetical protein